MDVIQMNDTGEEQTIAHVHARDTDDGDNTEAVIRLLNK
jgi:hypothetical protein